MGERSNAGVTPEGGLVQGLAASGHPWLVLPRVHATPPAGWSVPWLAAGWSIRTLAADASAADLVGEPRTLWVLERLPELKPAAPAASVTEDAAPEHEPEPAQPAEPVQPSTIVAANDVFETQATDEPAHDAGSTAATTDAAPQVDAPVPRRDEVQASSPSAVEALQSAELEAASSSRTLRRGDFVSHLGRVAEGPQRESWVLLAVRADGLDRLAGLDASTAFELEEQLFARLKSHLQPGELQTLWLEFGFGLLVRREDREAVEQLARQLCAHVAEAPFMVGASSFTLTVSVGMALSPPPSPAGTAAQRWFASAHAAQSIAHRHGGNRCEGVLTREFEPISPERVLIIRDWLEDAKSGNNLVIEFQPVVPLAGDRPPVYLACAKLRDFRDPLGGVYRSEFRAVAVGRGALTMIDRLSLYGALQALEQEVAAGRDTRLLVPIDASTLDGVAWRWVDAELPRRGDLARRLVLELYADEVVRTPRIVERFERLRSLGVRIGLYARGLEGLHAGAYIDADLMRVPASAFGDPGDAAELARWHSLGRQLVVDEVTGTEILRALSAMGVDYVCGDVLAPVGPKLDYPFA